MLIQVDDVVINTDQITYIDINRHVFYLEIRFDEGRYTKVKFPHMEDLNRFLRTIGREIIFA